ncbi:hypothetical protein [Nonomuraea sp. B19D2]|uniref:hypothetical protein n=1 Tax=Nonomuraea sp. B19D2 TaxID=3159561 RepID=UPI0032DB29FF
MRLTYLGKTGTSNEGSCPALYKTDRNTAVVQGKQIIDPAALADLRDLAPDEIAVEVPWDVLDLPREVQ